MKFRSSRPAEPDLNITPLIDVVFLLLIFFMVSTTFTRTSEISIELPEASESEVDEENRTVEIAIDAEGRYHIDGKRLLNTQRKTLKQGLIAAIQGLDKPGLIISADANTPHQAVITAMDAARQLGLTRLTFATRNPGQDGQ